MKTAKEFAEALQEGTLSEDFIAKISELAKDGISPEDAAVKAAESLGFAITKEDVTAAMAEPGELSENELENVAGGATWTAGTPYFNRRLAEILKGGLALVGENGINPADPNCIKRK